MGYLVARSGICIALAAMFAGILPGYDARLDVKLDVKPLVALFEARYRTAHTLQATFHERYTENSRVVRAESGTAYFRRPGKMRWEYEYPEKNLFLVDGKTAWFYVPADHTATRVPAKMSADWRTPLALLAGEMKVSRVCSRVQFAVDEKTESPGNVVLYCEVRGAGAKSQKSGRPGSATQTEETGEAVFFEIVKNTGNLIRVTVKDAGGVGIEFQFSNWKTDPQVSDALFRFEAPRGVAIVNGELPAGSSGVNP
jgi:outer membrane lipoprotein carrier protein